MNLRIFLSTVSDEFRTYRERLRGDLTRPNVDVKVQEDFKDLGGDTLDKLDVYIAHCNAVIHLVGDMTGSEPVESERRGLLQKHPDIGEKRPALGEALRAGAPISYTQWEAWLALYHDKLLFIAKADASAPRGPKYAPNDASRAAQAAHLKRLESVGRFPGCIFAGPDDLAKHIAYTAILDLLAEVRAKASQGAGALAIWEKRLAFLLEEEARASDAGIKFSIKCGIEEARAKIRELGGSA